MTKDRVRVRPIDLSYGDMMLKVNSKPVERDAFQTGTKSSCHKRFFIYFYTNLLWQDDCGHLDDTQGCSQSGLHTEATILCLHHTSLSFTAADPFRTHQKERHAGSLGDACMNPSTWFGILWQEYCTPAWTTWQNNNKTKPTSSHVIISPQNCSRVHVLKCEAPLNMGGGYSKYLFSQFPQVCTTLFLKSKKLKPKHHVGIHQHMKQNGFIEM